MTRVLSNNILVRLEMVLVSAQDRCMVCAKRTIGTEIVLKSMVLLGDKAQLETRFGLFGYSATLRSR